MGPAYPSLDYVMMCSEPAAESFELSRLNRASNLRKEMRELVDEWIDCEVEARVARWKRESSRAEIAVVETQTERPGDALPQQLALPLLFSSASAQGPRSVETSALLQPASSACEASARLVSAATKPPRDCPTRSLALAPDTPCALPIASCTATRALRSASHVDEVRRAHNTLVSFVRRRPQDSFVQNPVTAMLLSSLRSRPREDAQVPCTQASDRLDRAAHSTSHAREISRNPAPGHSRMWPPAGHAAAPHFAVPPACTARECSGD
ncbi:MAG TPA: hypothetical protein VEJ38_00910 [Candidatus Acidoferrales bacterium]|nr:hypothetical protein [Candidatus Acidoferrales bacterium]